MVVPQGKFRLQRLPNRKNERLRAWDAADEYLLQYVADHVSLSATSCIFILNDQFGALAIALNEFSPVAISDSYLSQQATRINLAVNRLEDTVQLKSSLQWPIEKADLVLIKVPKTLALLEDQLIRLQDLLTEKTIVIAAGMVKTMSSTVWKLMVRYLGETTPSLARKKARLIFVDVNLHRSKNYKNPYPIYYQLENTDYQICNHANVFSRESLDIGTRFLLKHLPQKTEAKMIVDLGCGNGVVGLMLARYHESATLFFIDESYMAIASAKENYQRAFLGRVAEFYVTDGLVSTDSESKDLIVCNPPFHQQHAMGSQLALSMFKQSHRVLKVGGILLVIGNRHLTYAIDLKKIFGVCKVVASNEKFTIWTVVKEVA